MLLLAAMFTEVSFVVVWITANILRMRDIEVFCANTCSTPHPTLQRQQPNSPDRKLLKRILTSGRGLRLGKDSILLKGLTTGNWTMLQ